MSVRDLHMYPYAMHEHRIARRYNSKLLSIHFHREELLSHSRPPDGLNYWLRQLYLLARALRFRYDCPPSGLSVRLVTISIGYDGSSRGRSGSNRAAR